MKLDETVTIRLPNDVYDNLDYLKNEFGINKSHLIRKAVMTYLDNNYSTIFREKERFEAPGK